MQTAHQKLFDEIDLLPIDLKTQFVDKLLQSITPSRPSIDALWTREAKKRKDAIESGEVALVDGEHVFQDIAKRLQA